LATEFELKFQVPEEALAGVAQAVRRGGGGDTSKLRATYYDTASGALARQRLVLRLRQEGRTWVQAAKAPGKGFERLEEEVRLTRKPAHPDIALHAGTRMHKLLCNALDDAGERADDLQPVYAMDVERITRTLRAGTGTVEIALDTGKVRAGRRTEPIREIEFELKEGDPNAVIEVARHWCEAHGLWLDPLTKAHRGQRLASGEGAGEPMRAQVAHGPKPRGTAELLEGMVDGALWHALANLREIAAGRASDEHVHQARVGIRRLRSVLRELGSLPELAALAAEAQEPLTVLFRQLGEDRDRRALLPKIEAEIRAAGGPHLDWPSAGSDATQAVRAPRVQAALLAVVGWVMAMRTNPNDETSPGDVRRLVGKRLARLQKRALDAGRKFESLAEEDRHTVRKRAKRLRYLAELARPLFDARKVDRYTRDLNELQDTLGEYQDYATALAIWSQRVLEEPGAAFGCGWIAARREECVRHAAKVCGEERKELKPFW
jgi:triphosphatase